MPDQLRDLPEKFWRCAKYYYFKVMHQSGSPEYIARGAAIGVFVGFFLPIGTQSIPAILLAFLFKGAKIPAFIMTFHSNYVTSFLFYPIQCYVGSYLIFNPLSWQTLSDNLRNLLEQQTLDALFLLGTPLIVSFFAGGLFFGILVSVPIYYLTIHLVIKFRARREKRRINRLSNGL
ncbi:MAG: DUF2062 domain-containing protein [Victivallales bacterium]|nr:DUF2062 domain-containing protein [Victivallales bacterium]